MNKFIIILTMLLPFLSLEKVPRLDRTEWEFEIQKIKDFDPLDRNLRLVPYHGGMIWVCDDPNCPEYCKEILEELKQGR